MDYGDPNDFNDDPFLDDPTAMIPFGNSLTLNLMIKINQQILIKLMQTPHFHTQEITIKMTLHYTQEITIKTILHYTQEIMNKTAYHHTQEIMNKTINPLIQE